jgi:hypothetical protein
MSRVAVFAPWRTAADSPTTMKRTPLRPSASKSARSAPVKTETEESSMVKSRAEALGGSLLEVAQHVVHAAHVDARVALGDALRSAPPLLVGHEPRVLLRREGIDRGHGR